MSEIVDIFNYICVKSGLNVAKEIKRTSIYKLTKYFNNNSLFINRTSPTEVFGIIRELENNKLPGIETLKSVTQYTAETISNIFNKIVETGQFSSCLKLYLVISPDLEKK